MHATATISPADSQLADARDARPADYERNDDCQYMRALERANEVRLARAELKRKVAAGALGAAEVVLECPWEAESMAVSDLLTSQRRWGHTRCRKLLAQVPLTERKTIGSMTDRQRRTLAALLSGGERREPSTPPDDDRSLPAEASAPPTSTPAAPSPRQVLVTA
jgi:hypothetical protein